MAAIKGIKEKVHLPLYDSVFVAPGKQLRDIATSSVLKFFVNIQGKTKLETNMQSTSLLPHWNTFEARALRVVVSDLPTRFSREVERCLTETSGTSNGNGSSVALARCIDILSRLICESEPAITDQQVKTARERLYAFKQTIDAVDQIPVDFDGAIGILRIYGNEEKVRPILELQSQLRQVRKPLLDVLTRTRIELPKPLTAFVTKLEELTDDREEANLLRQLPDVKLITDGFEQLVAVLRSIDKTQVAALETLFTTIEQFLYDVRARAKQLSKLKECLLAFAEELERRPDTPASKADITRCLNESLGDKKSIPIDDQLTRDSLRVLSKLVYNSVTSFIVGEKTMIQMPTWFFPAGAGPFSEDGQTVTHGLPAPEATFRFAEPVSIDTQQHFRVELEFPEADVADELQRIYGPFFIWVVLDGYMTRDVQ
jgi:hypothetical protein